MITTPDDPVRQYLNGIGVVPLLSADDERELAQAIERGREAQERLDAGERGRALRKAVAAGAVAKDRFVRANLRLVVSIAKRYPRPPSMELLDLIQEGNLGLIRAVEKFDWRKGFKFSTYAAFWIRQAIGRGLDRANLIHIPEEQLDRLRVAQRETGADEELDEDSRYLLQLMRLGSLEGPVDRDDRPLGELRVTRPNAPKHNALTDLAASIQTPEEAIDEMPEDGRIAKLLDVLKPDTRYVIERHFGLNGNQSCSYREIGAELGITAEGVRKRVRNALTILSAEVAETNAA